MLHPDLYSDDYIRAAGITVHNADRHAVGRGSFSIRPRSGLPRLSVVIPCFNEAANLNRLLPRLQAMLETLANDWEVILVDDGSRDHTPELFHSGHPGRVSMPSSCRATSARKPR